MFAIRVFVPQLYTTHLDSPEETRDTYAQIAAYKHAQLRRAHLALVLGFSSTSSRFGGCEQERDSIAFFF